MKLRKRVHKLSSELSIEIDYDYKRANPAAIFEAMALYINAYKDLGQILVNSIDLKTDFEFQLNSINEGSIISRMAALAGRFSSACENSLYSSGLSLFNDLSCQASTGSEEDVEALAVKLETDFSKALPQDIVDPHVDRQALAFVLDKLSHANSKLCPSETVNLYTGNKSNICELNTDWRFTGTPRKMFLGKTESYQVRDKLYVKISVNEGNSVWTFKSPAMNRRFPARITHKDWLDRYQRGLVQAIGPLDLLEVEISYDVYTPPEGRGQIEIRNAKVLSIIDIHRNNGQQHELET